MRHKLKIKELKRYFFKFYSPLCLFINNYVDDIEISKEVVENVFLQLSNDNLTYQIKNRLNWLLQKCFEHKAVKQKLPSVPLNVLVIRDRFVRNHVMLQISFVLQKVNQTQTNKKEFYGILNLMLDEIYSNAQIAEKLSIPVHAVNKLEAQINQAIKIYEGEHGVSLEK